MNGIDRLMLGTQDRAAIAEAVAVLRSRFAAESVTLYGSKANGTDDAESDIDLQSGPSCQSLVTTAVSFEWAIVLMPSRKGLVRFHRVL